MMEEAIRKLGVRWNLGMNKRVFWAGYIDFLMSFWTSSGPNITYIVPVYIYFFGDAFPGSRDVNITVPSTRFLTSKG